MPNCNFNGDHSHEPVGLGFPNIFRPKLGVKSSFLRELMSLGALVTFLDISSRHYLLHLLATGLVWVLRTLKTETDQPKLITSHSTSSTETCLMQPRQAFDMLQLLPKGASLKIKKRTSLSFCKAACWEFWKSLKTRASCSSISISSHQVRTVFSQNFWWFHNPSGTHQFLLRLWDVIALRFDAYPRRQARQARQAFNGL